MGLTFACQRARVAYRIEIWDDRETRPKTDRADGRSRGTARCFRRSSQAAWPAAGDKHRLNVFWLKALQCEAHRSIPNFHSRREQGLFGRERPDPGGRTQGCAGHPARTWKGHLRVSPPDLTHQAPKVKPDAGWCDYLRLSDPHSTNEAFYGFAVRRQACPRHRLYRRHRLRDCRRVGARGRGGHRQRPQRGARRGSGRRHKQSDRCQGHWHSR